MISDFSVSIIVHNFKGTDKLTKCIDSILKNTELNIDIIVVDALTEGIEEWRNSNYPQVGLLHFDEDEGIPARKNAAFSLIDPNSKYVVYMDEDIEVTDGWLPSLLRVMEKYPAIGAAQPLMLNLYERDKIDNAGCFIDYLGYPHKLKNAFTKRIYNVSYAETAIVLVRTKLIRELPLREKPFDPDYFVHWYDIDFSWLILLLGYKIVMVPESVVYHERRLSAASGRLPYRNIFFNTRNRYFTLIKNYSLKYLFLFTPSLMLLEFIKIVVLIKNNVDHAIATIDGTVWIIFNLRKIFQKRALIQHYVRIVPDKSIIKLFLKPNLLRLYRDFQENYV